MLWRAREQVVNFAKLYRVRECRNIARAVAELDRVCKKRKPRVKAGESKLMVLGRPENRSPTRKHGKDSG